MVGEMKPPKDSIQYQMAQRYAERGWPIVPLYWPVQGACSCRDGANCGSPAKHPLTEHGVKDATTDPETIEGWFRKWPRANIAIATGQPSGLLVFDVDPRNGGHKAFDAFRRQYGLFTNSCPQVWTGGGGAHLYFAYEGAAFPKDWGNGLDLLGDGRMAVAPYSEHVSGQRYRWAVSPW
jgi:Bifunctional DNA primase/polymerase, N-terminal